MPIVLIEGSGMVEFSWRSGDYLISVESNNPEFFIERFIYKFTKQTDGEIKYITLKNKSIVEENDGSNQNLNLTKYMCFIAGSTKINKWT